MRLHKSSTTTSLLERGPSALAMMVASEFWRAREGAEFHDEALRALWRARELMGVLEMVDLPEPVRTMLLPCYAECSLRSMQDAEKLTPPALQAFSARLGETFDQAAKVLGHA